MLTHEALVNIDKNTAIILQWVASSLSLIPVDFVLIFPCAQTCSMWMKMFSKVYIVTACVSKWEQTSVRWIVCGHGSKKQFSIPAYLRHLQQPIPSPPRPFLLPLILPPPTYLSSKRGITFEFPFPTVSLSVTVTLFLPKPGRHCTGWILDTLTC